MKSTPIRQFLDCRRTRAKKLEWTDRGRYLHAYGATQALSAVVVRGSGYKPLGEGHHEALFVALEYLAPVMKEFAKTFDKARRKREKMMYENPDAAAAAEASADVAGDVTRADPRSAKSRTSGRPADRPESSAPFLGQMRKSFSSDPPSAPELGRFPCRCHPSSSTCSVAPSASGETRNPGVDR